MGAGCSTVQVHNLEESMPSSREGGSARARSNDIVVKSMMAYIPSTVSQFYASHPAEVS